MIQQIYLWIKIVYELYLYYTIRRKKANAFNIHKCDKINQFKPQLNYSLYMCMSCFPSKNIFECVCLYTFLCSVRRYILVFIKQEDFYVYNNKSNTIFKIHSDHLNLRLFTLFIKMINHILFILCSRLIIILWLKITIYISQNYNWTIINMKIKNTIYIK